MLAFAEPMMPHIIEDLVQPMRQLKLDATEFAIMKILIFFRDEFYLSEEGSESIRAVRDRYSKLLYNYISYKLGDDTLGVINRYTEMLNFIPTILVSEVIKFTFNCGIYRT
jgi:hypothetical protein